MVSPITASSTNVLTASGDLDPAQPRTTIHLSDARAIVLLTSLLLQTSDDPIMPSAMEETVAFPIIEEKLTVGKRVLDTSKVTLEKHVHEYQETLNVPLAVRSFDIERVMLNQPVQEAPPIRYEGDTTIYPLVEEQLILTTQLILKEELRVTKRDTERRDTRTVTLKRESIEVTRTPLV